MASARDLDMLQTYVFGKVDVLNHLIDTVDGTGSRRFRVRLLGIRDMCRQHLEQVTRDMLAARQAEAQAEDAAKSWRDRAGPGLQQAFGKA